MAGAEGDDVTALVDGAAVPTVCVATGSVATVDVATGPIDVATGPVGVATGRVGVATGAAGVAAGAVPVATGADRVATGAVGGWAEDGFADGVGATGTPMPRCAAAPAEPLLGVADVLSAGVVGVAGVAGMAGDLLSAGVVRLVGRVGSLPAAGPVGVGIAGSLPPAGGMCVPGTVGSLPPPGVASVSGLVGTLPPTGAVGVEAGGTVGWMTGVARTPVGGAADPGAAPSGVRAATVGQVLVSGPLPLRAADGVACAGRSVPFSELSVRQPTVEPENDRSTFVAVVWRVPGYVGPAFDGPRLCCPAAGLCVTVTGGGAPAPAGVGTPPGRAAGMRADTGCEPVVPCEAEVETVDAVARGGVAVDAIVVDPVAVEPVAVDSVAVEPVAVDSVAVEPVAVDAIVVEPVAVDAITVDRVAVDGVAAIPCAAAGIADSPPSRPDAIAIAPENRSGDLSAGMRDR